MTVDDNNFDFNDRDLIVFDITSQSLSNVFDSLLVFETKNSSVIAIVYVTLIWLFACCAILSCPESDDYPLISKEAAFPSPLRQRFFNNKTQEGNINYVLTRGILPKYSYNHWYTFECMSCLGTVVGQCLSDYCCLLCNIFKMLFVI